MWFDFDPWNFTWLNCKGRFLGKKCLLYIQLEVEAYVWPGKLLDEWVCACVLACMHACLWMCVNVCVWVCACKFSISPWATPTHSHVSHSVSEKDPVRQSNLYLNGYDCRLAVFTFIFIDLHAYWTWRHRQQSCFCLWGGASWDKSRP